MENNRFTFSNFNQIFGKPQSVHRIRRGKFEIIFIPAVIFFLFLFGVLIYVASEDWLAIPVCVVVPFLLFCGMVRQLVSTRRDEIRIYENGFTHRSGKKLQSCLWKEIKIYRRRELNHREIAEMENETFPLASVEKKSGEIIVFDHDLPGTSEVIKGFENDRAKSKKM